VVKNSFIGEIEQNKEVLYRIAYSYFGNEHDALEAVQETAYRGYKNKKKFKKMENKKAWLIKVLINYCKNEMKKRKKVVMFSEIRDDSTCVEGMSKADKLYIQECVQNLESPYKEVIILRYYQDMKIKDIGEVLDTPENTVKTWLYKGIKLLGNVFKEGIEDAREL